MTTNKPDDENRPWYCPYCRGKFEPKEIDGRMVIDHDVRTCGIDFVQGINTDVTPKQRTAVHTTRSRFDATIR